MNSFQMIALAAIAVSVVGTLIAFRAFMAGRPSKRRRTDRRFSRREKRTIATAKQMILQNRIVPAAQLLESIGLVREAIDTLEERGFIDEAANTLLRMQRPNRAGVIYARHGQWQRAARCFHMANMPLELARCAREYKDFKTAAANFVRAEHFAEAAEAYAELDDLLNTSRCLSKAGNYNKANDIYLQLLESSQDLESHIIEDFEVDYFISQISKGQAPLAFVDTVNFHKRLLDPMSKLVKSGNIEYGAKVIERATSDVAGELVEKFSRDESARNNLLDLFLLTSNNFYAAKIYELQDNKQKAAEFYERAEEYDSAARNYKDCGLQDKYMEMNTKAKRFGDQLTKTQPKAFGDAPSVTTTTTTEPMPEAFRRCRFFLELEGSERQAFWQLGAVLNYVDEQIVQVAGQSQQMLYVVLFGELKYGERHYTPGQSIGEEAIEGPAPSDEDLLAQGNTKIWALELDRIRDVMNKDTTIGQKLSKNLQTAPSQESVSA